MTLLNKIYINSTTNLVFIPKLRCLPDIEELRLKINENPQMTFNPSTSMTEVNITWTSVLNQSAFEKYQVFWYTDDDEYYPKPGQNETGQTHMILELETNKLYTIDVSQTLHLITD